MDQGRNFEGTSGPHIPNITKKDSMRRAWEEADLRIKLQKIQGGDQTIGGLLGTHTGSEGIDTNTDDHKLDDHGVLEPSRPRVKKSLELIMHKDLSMAKKFDL